MDGNGWIIGGAILAIMSICTFVLVGLGIIHSL